MTTSQSEVLAGRRFAFGANWKSFADLLDDARIEAACSSLSEALGTSDIAGRTFLDAGCGSGLFSLAAHTLGAAQVRSFDFDPDAVSTAAGVRQRFAPRANWVIEQGSILDEKYIASLGQFDVVYSWGVVHHTGSVWRAIEAVAGLVAPGGRLFISVYNDQGFESRVWRRVKRRYNASGTLTRRMLVAASAAYLLRHRPVHGLVRVISGRSSAATRSSRARAMSARHDMLDWCGGYPFEVARPGEVFASVRSLGFELRHLKTCGGGIGCNEYVFERVPRPPLTP